MKILKKCSMVAIMLFPLLVQAQATSNLKVSANAIVGCNISGTDISFGILTKDGQEVDSSFGIRCSKGTTVLISGASKNQNGATGAAIMFKEGYSSKQTGRFLHYAIKTHAVVADKNFSILRRPYLDALLRDFGGVHNYTLQIKLLTQDEALLKVKGRVEMAYHGLNLQNVENGNYKDEYIYNIVF